MRGHGRVVADTGDETRWHGLADHIIRLAAGSQAMSASKSWWTCTAPFEAFGPRRPSQLRAKWQPCHYHRESTGV